MSLPCMNYQYPCGFLTPLEKSTPNSLFKNQSGILMSSTLINTMPLKTQSDFTSVSLVETPILLSQNTSNYNASKISKISKASNNFKNSKINNSNIKYRHPSVFEAVDHLKDLICGLCYCVYECPVTIFSASLGELDEINQEGLSGKHYKNAEDDDEDEFDFENQCNHTFCKNCIIKHMNNKDSTDHINNDNNNIDNNSHYYKCPICTRAFEPQHLKADLGKSRMIADLMVLCPYKLEANKAISTKGLQIPEVSESIFTPCTWTGKFGKRGHNLLEHLESCSVTYYSCQYYNLGCTVRFRSQYEIEQHLKLYIDEHLKLACDKIKALNNPAISIVQEPSSDSLSFDSFSQEEEKTVLLEIEKENAKYQEEDKKNQQQQECSNSKLPIDKHKDLPQSELAAPKNPISSQTVINSTSKSSKPIPLSPLTQSPVVKNKLIRTLLPLVSTKSNLEKDLKLKVESKSENQSESLLDKKVANKIWYQYDDDYKLNFVCQFTQQKYFQGEIVYYRRDNTKNCTACRIVSIKEEGRVILYCYDMDKAIALNLNDRKLITRLQRTCSKEHIIIPKKQLELQLSLNSSSSSSSSSSSFSSQKNNAYSIAMIHNLPKNYNEKRLRTMFYNILKRDIIIELMAIPYKQYVFMVVKNEDLEDALDISGLMFEGGKLDVKESNKEIVQINPLVMK